MLRLWRRAAVATLAGAAAIAAQLTFIAPSQAAATPTISITATSKIKPVTGDVMIVYLGGTYGSAKIHGKISGAAAGEVAVLYGQRFPFTRPAKRLAAVTLKSSTQAYSFTVAPELATHYWVKLFASSTARVPLATSKGQWLYVATNGKVTGGSTCARPVCHETFHIYTILPPPALTTEIGKHVYPYVGLNLNPTSEPPPPSWLYLNAYSSSVTTGHKISADEFENTLTFSLTIGNDGFYFNWTACAKDTLSKDGMGLPGTHGCGTLHRVSGTNVPYLG